MTRLNRESQGERERLEWVVEVMKKKTWMRKRKLTASSHDCHKFSCKIHVHLFGMCCEFLFVRFHNLRDSMCKCWAISSNWAHTHTLRKQSQHKKSWIDGNQCTPISQAVRFHEWTPKVERIKSRQWRQTVTASEKKKKRAKQRKQENGKKERENIKKKKCQRKFTIHSLHFPIHLRACN